MKKIKDYLAGIIFLGVGILLFGIFSIFGAVDNSFKKDAIKTTGVISQIYYNYSAIEESDEVDVIVSFKDSLGIEHEGRSNYYSSDMKIGDPIVIYYKENNPNNFRVESSPFMNLIFYVVSGICVGIGILLIIIPFLKEKKGNKLIKTGVKLTATITNVFLNSSYQVNGRSPYVINASFIYEGLVYETKSNNLWYDAGFIIDSKGIKELPVYIEPGNPKKNYLDTRELEQYIGK